MRVLFSPLAERDVELIGEYLEERNPRGAVRVIDAIRHSVSLVADFPGSGLQTARTNVRVVMAGPYPYKIFYRQHADHIEIIHVRHASCLPWSGAEDMD